MARTSNQSAYNDNGLNLAVAEAAALAREQGVDRAESDYNDSDREHAVVVPAALGSLGSQAELTQNDIAMNVPTSFDHRAEIGQSYGPPISSRLNSNHLQLVGATNPVAP